MNDIQISTYVEPHWGAKLLGTAMIRKDSQGHYTVDNVRVTDMQVRDLFTILGCVDGKTHYVFTAFFRQVDRPVTL